MTMENLLLTCLVATVGLLQAISLGLAGWILLEVISHGKDISSIKTKLGDLPCDDCPNQN